MKLAARKLYPQNRTLTTHNALHSHEKNKTPTPHTHPTYLTQVRQSPTK